ncbi:hypothetical protein DENIT_20162 [Pseudomonas veronii]|uniref:hypothetical protein n=1 Tax=Pseudomonas veronii TaxID=76761 RepID=UPI0017564BE2|nr:hypothetical protein [Pseudomonas veronii]CAD0264273.1 hypothetical protein DENIT_20162 [Pseudomonas veronii]
MNTSGFLKGTLFTGMAACVGWIIVALVMFELAWLVPSINAAALEKAGPAGAVLGVVIYWLVSWISGTRDKHQEYAGKNMAHVQQSERIWVRSVIVESRFSESAAGSHRHNGKRPGTPKPSPCWASAVEEARFSRSK